MFSMPLNRENVMHSQSDASTLNIRKRMTDLMHHVTDPTKKYSGSVGNIPQNVVTTINSPRKVNNIPIASVPNNQNSQFEKSPMTLSKSYMSGLSSSSGTVNVQNNSNNLNLNLINDISPNHSQFFEVMYVGKIKVSHKRVPFTFIDDALPKFKAYDAQRIKDQMEQSRRNSNSSDSGSIENDQNKNYDEIHELKIVEDEMKDFKDKILNTKISDDTNKILRGSDKPLLRGQTNFALPIKKRAPMLRDRSASIGCIPVFDQNRTMVFLVGRSDLRLISPDKKQVLLYKEFKDIATCCQGHKNSDHFGIICREVQTEGYIGYVFKCQSEQFADDIVAAISQAFSASLEQKSREKSQLVTCDHCPIVWYQRLLLEVDGLNDKKSQSTIFRRIDTLSEEEQEIIMAKYYGAEEMAIRNISEQNQFLLMLLRAHCESRQQRHVHDTAENRSEFLNQYLGGSTIFMKAKRSLTNSFDHLLKRKGSKEDINEHTPIEYDTSRRKSTSTTSGSIRRGSDPDPLKSPMMDIFFKVGNSPKKNSSHIGSWRQEIFHRVVTPTKNSNESPEIKLISPARVTQEKPREKKTKEDLRQLWQTAIRQVIILSRMEKENARLQLRHNQNEIRKIKLDYDEISICDKQSAEMWEVFIDREGKQNAKRDRKVLLQAIKNGVPRIKRGEVWMFLAEQSSMNTAPIDTKNFPNYNTPYEALLKCLTEHQHAIFIDLGRTFPNHKYYKQALGIGQLSLFNLLKAYSILDPELGYCQGLGFICGILLLHLDEVDAFQMLKHLMFKRQMRTKYLPDMKKFQLQLYQMSRLLRDQLPELYTWLDQNEISPTLYAAPWILTVFSSQFPLGFVTRVFDLLFLESSEVIFKVAVSLLEIHKENILQRESFEDIMEYLKNDVPKVDSIIMDKVMKQVFCMDISRKLIEYQVEYNVLQEEMTTQNHHLDNFNKVKEENHQLTVQLQSAQASILEMEKMRGTQTKQIQILQSQVQSFEVTIETLGQYIKQLVDTNHDMELPGEVRRIVQQFNYIEPHKKISPLERKIGKSKSVTSIGLPLRVLEELNENVEKDSVTNTNKKPSYFENTYEKIRQQKLQSKLKLEEFTNKIPVHVEKSIPENSKPTFPFESEINLSPSSSGDEMKPETMHPLSNCGDVNFSFNGTSQLKSIRPVHSRNTTNSQSLLQQIEKNRRS